MRRIYPSTLPKWMATPCSMSSFDLSVMFWSLFWTWKSCSRTKSYSNSALHFFDSRPSIWLKVEDLNLDTPFPFKSRQVFPHRTSWYFQSTAKIDPTVQYNRVYFSNLPFWGCESTNPGRRTKGNINRVLHEQREICQSKHCLPWRIETIGFFSSAEQSHHLFMLGYIKPAFSAP